MGEGGLLSGVLGEDEGGPEGEGTTPAAGAEAYAAAVAERLSQQDAGVARRTRAFLGAQTRLLEVQREHLEAEHVVRMRLLRGQRTSQLLRLSFQILIALLLTVLGTAVLVIFYDAVSSRRVVVEPFSVPASYPTRGVSGAVLANAVLDQLSKLQDATRTSSAALDTGGAWAQNLKLEVPETGVSIGELARTLRERFGHDVRLDGDLVEMDGGRVALTVRGSGVAPRTLTGPSAELDRLVTLAAEHVYAQSQPARWAIHLTQTGRDAEAVEFARARVVFIPDPGVRAALFSAWAIAEQDLGGDTREALALYREALNAKPDMWEAHANVMNAQLLLGDEEAAWQEGQRMLRGAGGRPGRARDILFQNLDLITWNLGPWLANMEADVRQNAVGGTAATDDTPAVADAQVRLHDLDGARVTLKTMVDDRRDPTIAAMRHFVLGRLAAETGDVDSAARELEAFDEALRNPQVSANYPGYRCWIAPALEAAGRRAQADAVLATAGHFVDCYRFRADILDGRGDWAGARQAYAAAIALAPDLPAAYYSYGLALAKHGDLAGAATQLSAAHARGPHWADPLKAWGDVLMRQNQREAAARKYDEALQYAPRWQGLIEARSAVKTG